MMVRTATLLSRVIAPFSKSWQYVCPRLGGAIFAAIALWLPLLVFTWYFDVIDDLQARALITFSVAFLVVLQLMSGAQPWYSRREFFWFGTFLYLSLAMLAGRRFELPVVSMNAAMLIIALPYSWFAWVLMGRRLILVCALLFGLVWMLGYWLKAMADADAPLGLLSVPVPIFMVVGIIWAPLARFALDRAQRYKNRRLAGPGTQILAMVSLFLPVILVAIFVPGMLELSETWSAASLTIVGVLLSAVVAEPLRRFLVLWAKLGPDDG